MTGKRLIIAALVLALAQIGFLGWIIAGRAAILRDGQEVLLKVEPIDPRDLLRGDYVRLGYEISRIPVKLIADIPADKLSSDDTSIVVRLKKGADGYWQPTAASFGQAPTPAASDEADIVGHVGEGWSLREGHARSRRTTASSASICRKARAWRSRTTCGCGRSASGSRSQPTARRRSRR